MDRTQTVTEIQTLDDEELDELVHDECARQASDINNQGREAQLRFLAQAGVREV